VLHFEAQQPAAQQSSGNDGHRSHSRESARWLVSSLSSAFHSNHFQHHASQWRNMRLQRSPRDIDAQRCREISEQRVTKRSVHW